MSTGGQLEAGVLIPSPDSSNAEKGMPQDQEKKEGLESSTPFSVFTLMQKRFIVFIVAMTTLLPPLTASIFYPVIPLLARELHVSIADINLTITIYLVRIAPSFVGNFSDEIGRRPALLISLIIYIAGSIGAAVRGNYGLLFAMRALQSAGSSGTIALSLATVSDIVTSAERGSYTSYVQMGWMLGPSLAPIIGGLLSQYLGWQSIFWFLAIYAATVWTVSFVFLPETSRNIVGNGSNPPSKWNMTLHAHLRRGVSGRKANSAAVPTRLATTTRPSPSSSTKRANMNPLNPLKLFRDKESCLLLIYSGLIYASTYMVLSTLSDELEEKYGFDTVRVSLCYLASGLGTVTSVLLTGRILDWNFRRHARLAGIEISKQKQQDLTSFPVEVARLQSSVPALVLASVSLIAYGWTLQAGTHLAAPLIFLFLQSFGRACAFSGLNNLIMDLNRDKPGRASAAMNLTRCWLGAGGTAFASPLARTGGVGWLGVVIPGIWLLFSPLLYFVIRRGPKWREEKRTKEICTADTLAARTTGK
ncbi:major facilitator superfamily domain-containing protein [Xylariaceae sp. FL0594]|nr:major facilitator superfamily domain-containing protein [Xylariaceae sp. FL0594]